MNNYTVICRFALLAVAGILGGCKPSREQQAPAVLPTVSVQAVSPRLGPITRTVTLPGEVKAFQQATLYAKVAGYLKTIPVDKGDPVQAGALLAEIEVPELLADLAKFKAELQVAELDYKRLNDSQKKLPDLVVPQAVDNARGKFAVAAANLERTEALLSFAKITAPFSGVVTRRMVDPGAFIPAATSGSSAQNAALLTLTDFNRVRVQVAVPEAEASLVATNQPASVTVEGLPGRKFDGTITRFSYALDEASKTMLAEIELPNPTLALRPGMYATVKIGLERKEKALLIPVRALLLDKTGASVFSVANNKAKKMRVQTGFNDGANIEIRSGLEAEQPVIVMDKQALQDGQPVQVTEAK
jgi:RND family efflux transporter MFP subunit